jgi:hypothetical protein
LSRSSASFHFAADEVLVSLLAVAGKFLSAIFCSMVGFSAIETEVLLEASLLFFSGNLISKSQIGLEYLRGLNTALEVLVALSERPVRD